MAELQGVKVCMITTGHPPDDDRIFYKEARSLVKMGATVTIIYPCIEGEVPQKTFGVNFKCYNGGNNLMTRVITFKKLKSLLREIECDILHCHEPDALLAALVANKYGKMNVIFDSHEMWSAVAASKFPKPFWGIIQSIYRIFEKRLVRKCNGIIGATWSISDYFRGYVKDSRVVTILNVPVVDIFGDWEKADWGDETILCHDGYLTFKRGLKVLAEAVKIVSKKHKVVLKIIGDVYGKEKKWLDSFAKKNRLNGIIQKTGWLKYHKVGKEISQCHIGLIGFTDASPNFLISAPNKLFNYLLYGVPFIGPNFKKSAMYKIAHEEKCGLLVENSPESYAKAIAWMIENREETIKMSERALLASKNKYRWYHMEPKLLEIYKEILNK